MVSLCISNLCLSFVFANRTFIDEMCLMAYTSPAPLSLTSICISINIDSCVSVA